MNNTQSPNQDQCVDLMGIQLSQFLNHSHVPIFVINKQHEIMYWNHACETFFGISSQEILHTKNQWKPFYEQQRPVLADAIIDGLSKEKMIELYGEDYQASHAVSGAYESKGFFFQLGKDGLWLRFVAAPLYNKAGELFGAFEMFEDITAQKKAEISLKQIYESNENLIHLHTKDLNEKNQNLTSDLQYKMNIELELIEQNKALKKLNEQLISTQEQLERADKMASIGQLAAGVAHEINNPIGYIFSNIGALERYLDDLFEMLDFYESVEHHISSDEVKKSLSKLKEKTEIKYLKEDIPDLILQSKDCIDRVRKIVQDLKDFSHIDNNMEWQWADIHGGIESTLNVINSEVKYKADVIKKFGDIPNVECFPSQINQVIMNLVVNSSHAMSDDKRGTITISTNQVNERIKIEVSDDGSGIPEDVLKRIFEPFYTTKPVGKGTGLGLSLSYGIIEKHHGEIHVESTVGKGTTFTIFLPIKQTHNEP
jgi:two-component system NtrC family sensor kinase